MILNFIPEECARSINQGRHVCFNYNDYDILANILQELWVKVNDFSEFLYNNGRFPPNKEFEIGKVIVTFVDHIENNMYSDANSVMKIHCDGITKYIRFAHIPGSYDACHSIYDIIEVFPKEKTIIVYEE